MSDNFKKNHFSPVGQLLWSYVFSPDSGGKYSDDKYKVKLRLYGDEAQEMIQMLESFAPEASEQQEGREITKFPYEPALDKDKQVIPGAYDFQLKTKNAPQVVDAQRRKVTKAQLNGFKDGGILGRGAVAFKPHSWTVKRESGIGLYLQAVQIVELQGGSVDLNQFAAYDDGFTADTSVSSFSDGVGEDDIPDFAA